MARTHLHQINALILAGSRSSQDPVAKMAGTSHKAVVPINGIPMLLRLFRTLKRDCGIESVHVCIDTGISLVAIPELAEAMANGQLIVVPPVDSPAASVVSALDIVGHDRPLLITTADHPLLTAAMVDHLVKNAPPDCDLAVGLADANVVTAAYPGSIRTFYRLKERRVSGCNLFLVRSSKARSVAEFWRRMEKFRKKPWRLALEVGLLPFLAAICGMLGLDAAFAHISKLTRAVVQPVLLPFAEAAIDVDKPADFDLVTDILRKREGSR